MRAFLIWGLLACLPLLAEPVGIENEYYYTRQLFTSRHQIPNELYLKILRKVQPVLGGTPPSIEAWSRESELPSGVAIDRQGRSWRVVPEYIHAGFRDGFEFVAPPLVGDEDSQALRTILEQIEQEGEFSAGSKSSSHFTIGVDHLVAADGNASKLVNAILFVESHWPEIYALFSPTRAGNRVNRFSVPLSADLPELFHELRALRGPHCTFDRVKALFESYHPRELQLANEDLYKAWKFRALNYKKLFGLGGTEASRVLELRIPDLTTSSQLIPRLALVRALFTWGAKEGESLARFNDRFAGVERGIERVAPSSVSELLNAGQEAIRALLSRLKLRPEFFPVHPPAALALRGGISTVATQNLAPTSPGFATFGWEFELKGEGEQLFLAGGAVNVSRFPFLTPNMSREGSGNLEVRSVPTYDSKEAFRQMRTARRAAGESGRGFHFRIRVPQANVPNLPPDELKGWLARIGDSIWAWRLQNRLNSFALSSRTVNRPNIDYLQNRAAIRVQTLADGSLDVELRGLMTDIDQIESYSQAVLAGLSHPELIRGFAQYQRTSLHGNMAEFVSRIARQSYQRSLSTTEYSALHQLGLGATAGGLGNVPLWGLEQAPFLTALQRKRVKSAQAAFVLRALKIVGSSTPRPTNEAQIEFRVALKLFAADLDLQGLLNDSLLLPADFVVSEQPIEDLAIPRALSQSEVVTEAFELAPSALRPTIAVSRGSETIPQRPAAVQAIDTVEDSFARGAITQRQQEQRRDEIVRLENTAYQVQTNAPPHPQPTAVPRAEQWLEQIRSKLGEWDGWLSGELNRIDQQFLSRQIDLYQWEQQARGISQRYAYGTFELHRMHLSDSTSHVPASGVRAFVDTYCTLVRERVDTWYGEKVRYVQNEVASGRMGTQMSAVAIAWPRYLTLVVHDHIQAILNGRAHSMIGRADLPYSSAPTQSPVVHQAPNSVPSVAPFRLHLVNSAASVVLVADNRVGPISSRRYDNASLSEEIRVHPNQPVEVHAINSSVSVRRVGNVCMQLLQQNSSVSAY
jgi:hypothetical protein